MKIQITRPTRVNGESVAIGDEVETDRKSADLLLALRKARPAPKKASKPKTDKSAT